MIDGGSTAAKAESEHPVRIPHVHARAHDRVGACLVGGDIDRQDSVGADGAPSRLRRPRASDPVYRTNVMYPLRFAIAPMPPCWLKPRRRGSPPTFKPRLKWRFCRLKTWTFPSDGIVTQA